MCFQLSPLHQGVENLRTSTLYSASELQKLVNSAVVNMTKIINEMDRLPLIVFPSFLCPRIIFCILNSKLYSDGTKQHKNNRKENMYKHP